LLASGANGSLYAGHAGVVYVHELSEVQFWCG
jgi:hypothetical protein